MIMSNNTSSSSSGIFPSLLTVLFIGLKLTGHITWSWWWVLSPLWISALIGLTILAIVLIIAVATGFFKLLTLILSFQILKCSAAKLMYLR